MQTPHEVAEVPHPQPQVEVHIHVNGKAVVMIGPRHTGLEIKQAAIAQGVKIDVDFLLYLIRPGHANKLIDNDEVVAINNQSEFRAIADDDNS
jgi:hypothetical protein